MASTSQPSRAERVARTVQRQAGGGFISADVPNAATSAAAMRRPTSMRRNTTRRQVTRSSRASSRASDGFTTIGQERLSSVPSFRALNPILRISRCPGRLGPCLQTGKHGSTIRHSSIHWLSIDDLPTDFVSTAWPRHAGDLECLFLQEWQSCCERNGTGLRTDSVMRLPQLHD